MRIRYTVFFLSLFVVLSACGAETVPAETEQIPVYTTTNSTTETVAWTEPTETAFAETEPVQMLPVTEPEDADFVLVRDYIPDILVELKYATTDNFLGKAVYDFSNVYLRYGTVKKLMAVQQELREMGFRLKIWDGFRPMSAQRALWEVCPDPNFVSNPDTGRCTHSRGNTVDITLADAKGCALEMPTGFDDFSPRADRSYYDCSELASKNAELLEELMQKHGFEGYYNEWWHYADTIDYPIAQSFDGELVPVWYVTEPVSLREKPDMEAETTMQMSAGDTVTLLEYDGSFAKVSCQGMVGFILRGYLSSGGTYETEYNGESLYYADCRQFISLRAEADSASAVITHITAGEIFPVLEWEGDFALVSYHGLMGYVLNSYLKSV